jgi:hypothetical protein
MDLNTDSFLGAGDTYIDWLNADGSRNGLDYAGNATALSIQSSAEVKEQTGKGRNNYGQVIATATINQPPSVSLTLNQLNMKTIAMALLGSLSDVDVTAGSVTDEEVTIESLDKYFRLSQRNVDIESGLSVTRQAGSTASAHATETAYSVGDYAVPTTPNEHFYKCTVAGTSGVSEPTWPTDGTTVTDGDATWQDMGKIVAVQDTDYEVTSRNGMIRALSTGQIEAGEVLLVSFDYASVTGLEVLGAVQPTIKAYIFLDGTNLVNGKDVEVEVWEVQLKPDSPIDFLADDFNSLELSGTPKTPSGKSAPYRIRQYN